MRIMGRVWGPCKTIVQTMLFVNATKELHNQLRPLDNAVTKYFVFTSTKKCTTSNNRIMKFTEFWCTHIQNTYRSTPCIQKYLGSCIISCAHCNINWYSQLEIREEIASRLSVLHKLVVDADINTYSIDGLVISFNFKKKFEHVLLPAYYSKPNWGDSAL